MTNQAAQTMPVIDDFNGDNAKLIESARALISLSDSGSLAPHGIGGHARAILSAFIVRTEAAALSQTAGVPSWIVNDLGELGVMVNGVAYFLYKGDNIVYEDAKHDDGSPMMYRMVGKREFGEVCRPRHWEESGWAAAHRYTQELVYTPGLSFGKPKDGDWRPLPAKVAAPAASGGECHKPCTPIDFFNGDACPDCVTRDYSPNPPSAAPVSERARALLADEYERNGHLERAAIVRGQALHPDSLDAIHLRAIEQALTQQRVVGGV